MSLQRTTNNEQRTIIMPASTSHPAVKPTVQTLTSMKPKYKITGRTRMSLIRTTPRTGPMKRQLITKLHATLEKLVHKETATGTEFWLARDLQEVLGYVRWTNFEKVIQKAMVACERATNDVDDHFLPVDKIDELAHPTNNVR